jgi:hypothetical protein
VLATGRLERHAAAGGQVNVIVQSLEGIAGDLRPARRVVETIPLEAGLARKHEQQARRLPAGVPESEEAQIAAEDERGVRAALGGIAVGGAHPEEGEGLDASDFRTVAPPVMSFAQGRRR